MSEMQEFEFDLTIQLPDGALDIEEIVDALFNAGLDDSVVGLGTPGMIGIGCVRDGEDFESAVAEAVEAALSALPAGAAVISVTRHEG
jgi:hypothetical protein